MVEEPNSGLTQKCICIWLTAFCCISAIIFFIVVTVQYYDTRNRVKEIGESGTTAPTTEV